MYASYIRSAENSPVDAEMRKLDLKTEYESSYEAFNEITSPLREPKMLLFTSRKNFEYMRCEPGSEVIDAFTPPWKNQLCKNPIQKSSRDYDSA